MFLDARGKAKEAKTPEKNLQREHGSKQTARNDDKKEVLLNLFIVQIFGVSTIKVGYSVAYTN